MRLSALWIASALLGILPWPAQSGSAPPEFKDLAGKLGKEYSLTPDLPDSLLARPLTAGSSARIALARNPRIRAMIQEAALARSERGEIRKLPNPEVDARFANAEEGWHSELSIMVDVTGFISYPWQSGAGNARYQAALSRLAAEVIGRTLEVRMAYFRAVTAARLRETFADAAVSFEAAAELARRQRKAGTMNAIDLAQAEAAEVEAQGALEMAEAEAAEAREKLGQAIGLPPSEWKLPDSLPQPPETDPDSADLLKAASSGNPALRAAREAALGARRTVSLARLSYLPALKAGAFVQQDPGAERLFGPAVALELPLFNWGGSLRDRARAEQEIADRRLAASELELPSEIRAGWKTMVAARRNHKTIRDRLIPLRRVATAEALKQYNFMLTGVYQLLASRREETAAQRSGIEALNRYWMARAGVEALMGGELPSAMEKPLDVPPPTAPENNPAPSLPQHQHNGD